MGVKTTNSGLLNRNSMIVRQRYLPKRNHFFRDPPCKSSIRSAYLALICRTSSRESRLMPSNSICVASDAPCRGGGVGDMTRTFRGLLIALERNCARILWLFLPEPHRNSSRPLLFGDLPAAFSVRWKSPLSGSHVVG